MNQTAFASHTVGMLANRYKIKQLIGKGGMGQVFLADDLLLGGVPVAIKLLTHAFANREIEQDFAREAKTSAFLSQKSINIVKVSDYGISSEGKPFYVMEYLNGKSLTELIPMALPAFFQLTRQICLGLYCAHQGINIKGTVYPLVHRDIKPANVLVIPDAILGQLAKIVDFGIAKYLNLNESQYQLKGVNGTLPYCSPEQLDGDELDKRSDIYSLGVMMFEMLTGEKPYQPDTDYFGAWYQAHHFEPPRKILDINSNLVVPKALEDLIMACLAKQPSDRPQHLGEIIQALASLTGEEDRSCFKGQENEILDPQANTVVLPTGWAKLNTNVAAPNAGATLLLENISSSTSLPVAVEQACWKHVWASDKPIREIVYPDILNTTLGEVAALSLMMSDSEINKSSARKRYNQFVFVTSPSPMLLWLTVLHSSELGARWLPCYLDMENPQNQKLIATLAQHDRYPLIFFALEPPHSCTRVLSCSIAPSQRQLLSSWLTLSFGKSDALAKALSKNFLKQHYQKMQVKILQWLE